MRAVSGVLGVLLVALTMLDVFRTTLQTSGGAGPLTSRLAAPLWSLLLRLRRRTPLPHRLLALAGPYILAATVLLWAVLLWAGWALIFSAGEQAVVEAQTGEPADVWARIYYAGFAVFTLGLGDYKPKGALWQVLTPLATLNGFLTVTLAVTYLLPVVSAATQKRQLGAYLAGLGTSAEGILLDTWNGASFGALGQHLVALTPAIILHGQRHRAYPVLHYFHSGERRTAAMPGLAALDEALTILEHGVRGEVRPDPATLRPVRAALAEYLRELRFVAIPAAEPPPPVPSLERLRAAGIPVVEDAAFRAAVAGLGERRGLLLGVVRHHGWSWEDVEPGRRADRDGSPDSHSNS